VWAGLVGVAHFYSCGRAVGEAVAGKLREGKKGQHYGGSYWAWGRQGGRVKEGYLRRGRPLELLHGAEGGGRPAWRSGKRGGSGAWPGSGR
jgi:hypothetical protein